MPARPEQATASREERATTASNGRTTVASRGIQRAGQAPVITPVNQTVPMTDALIGRACSTHADLRRRTPWSSHSLVALLVFALLYVVDARARTAATWAPSARHNRRRPPFSHPSDATGIPERVSPFDPRVHQSEPQRTLAVGFTSTPRGRKCFICRRIEFVHPTGS